jgi:hypothetical protein
MRIAALRWQDDIAPSQTERTMPQYPARQATEILTRTQLAMFHALADQVSLSEDDRRRALDLDDRTWRAWANFLAEGPLPTEPTSEEMLRRLGKATFILSFMADRTQGDSSSVMSPGQSRQIVPASKDPGSAWSA